MKKVFCLLLQCFSFEGFPKSSIKNLYLPELICLLLLSLFRVLIVFCQLFSYHSCTIKFSKSFTPKESKRYISVFGWMSQILYQCVPFVPDLSVLEIKNWYFVFAFSFIKEWKVINRFISSAGKTQTKLFFKSSFWLLLIILSIQSLIYLNTRSYF